MSTFIILTISCLQLPCFPMRQVQKKVNSVYSGVAKISFLSSAEMLAGQGTAPVQEGLQGEKMGSDGLPYFLSVIEVGGEWM